MSFTDAREFFRDEQEKVDLLAQLEPYETIATPADAQEGSKLQALHLTVQTLTEQRDGHVSRITDLRGKLQVAREALDAALGKDDFATAATYRAQLSLLSESLQASEAAVLAVDDQLAAAERELEVAWSLISNARTILRQLIEHGDQPPTYRYQSRAPHAWGYLRDFLDMPVRADRAA